VPTTNAPPDAIVTRFRDDLTALTGAIRPDGRIGLAVSGGPDSLALLLLAHAAFPGGLAVASVNHGLRPEAAEEVAMVARLCAERGIPHAALVSDERWQDGGNVQERARILRYRLLAAWASREAISIIATAHHSDDVAESFLMRALRGSGVGGLARMKARTKLPYAESGVTLVRPLLRWGRAELAAIVEAAGIAAAQDPSNLDMRFDRVRVRVLLAREAALDPAALAQSAANLADAEAALEWASDIAWRSRVVIRSPHEIHVDAEGLPAEIRRRLAARAIILLEPDWNREGLDPAIAKLDKGGTVTLGGVKASGGRNWHFGVAPARRGGR
jgi:tRNA(Ile)-lysidine synthase